MVHADDAVNDGPNYAGAFHFRDSNGTQWDTEYEYDKNGRLTRDRNKGILQIQYNLLNLPSKTTFSDQGYINYQYSASGMKQMVWGSAPGQGSKSQFYLGNYVYGNGVKQLLVDGGYVTFSGTTPQYHFYVKDHLGNNRMVVNASGTVEQVCHYYAFGGLMGENTGSDVQDFKYNGKELDRLHGLDWYDYNARHMDAVRGVFTTMDPLAEKYYDISPYAYCGNNPIIFIDPEGMDWLHARGDSVFWYGGNLDDKSELKYSFASTSGNIEFDKKGNFIKSYQKAKFQLLEKKGPTPEGEYEINLEPSPLRHAKIINGEYVPNSLGGIEMTEYSENGMTYSSNAWGSYRARLNPVEVNGNIKRDLSSFYFHDSKKGYTHGCIEVESLFFNILFQYREHNNFIKVRVQYPSPNHITNGGTKR